MDGGKPGDSEGVSCIFHAFCGGATDMDGKSFAKLCKDCGLLGAKFTSTDVDLIFAKVVEKGKRRIGFAQFEIATDLIANKKKQSKQIVLDAVLAAGAPHLNGTKADNVRFHDDKSTFTGVHKNGGPDRVAKGAGTITPLASTGMVATNTTATRPVASAGAPSASQTTANVGRPVATPLRTSTAETAPPPQPASARNPVEAPHGSLQGVFKAFAAGGMMDGKSFVKLCKDCKLIDKKFSVTEADLLFSKVCPKGQRRIDLRLFEDALEKMADRKGMGVPELTKKIVEIGGPHMNGTQADAVRFHDDKSTYTGTHVNGGPEHVAVGIGTSSVLASAGMKLAQ